jgi:serine/threonine-protein kinase
LRDLAAVSRSLELESDAGQQSIAPVPAHRGGDASHKGSPSSTRHRRRRVIESLGVLPLVNNSADLTLEYFTDGLTENLINNLSQIPRLRVMARSTVFRYKGHSADPQTIGRQLGVQAVLTGHVARRADAFVVGAELVDVQDGSQLWGTLLNRAVSDVSVLHAEISEELTGALRLRLSRDEKKRLGKRHTASAEAYQLYLRGRYFLNSRTGDALRDARVLFERAVTEDPRFALAHAGLADCCSLIAVSQRAHSGATLIEQARTAALEALRLDDGLAEAHASLAFIKFRFDWDWPGAEAGFTRALSLNPGHAPSRQWYAMFLASRARFEEGLAEMNKALDLDPLSLNIQTGVGRILHFAGRVDEAAAQYEHVMQTNPGFAQAHIDLALARMARNELPLAREELTRARELLGQSSTILLLEGCCAVREGRHDEARAAFDGLRERYDRAAAGADDLATLAAALGDWTAARAWLTEACTQRAPFLGYVDVEPAMSALLDDDECREILRRNGFRAAAPSSRA